MKDVLKNTPKGEKKEETVSISRNVKDREETKKLLVHVFKQAEPLREIVKVRSIRELHVRNDEEKDCFHVSFKPERNQLSVKHYGPNHHLGQPGHLDETFKINFTPDSPYFAYQSQEHSSKIYTNSLITGIRHGESKGQGNLPFADKAARIFSFISQTIQKSVNGEGIIGAEQLADILKDAEQRKLALLSVVKPLTVKIGENRDEYEVRRGDQVTNVIITHSSIDQEGVRTTDRFFVSKTTGNEVFEHKRTKEKGMLPIQTELHMVKKDDKDRTALTGSLTDIQASLQEFAHTEAYIETYIRSHPTKVQQVPTNVDQAVNAAYNPSIPTIPHVEQKSSYSSKKEKAPLSKAQAIALEIAKNAGFVGFYCDGEWGARADITRKERIGLDRLSGKVTYNGEYLGNHVINHIRRDFPGLFTSDHSTRMGTLFISAKKKSLKGNWAEIVHIEGAGIILPNGLGDYKSIQFSVSGLLPKDKTTEEFIQSLIDDPLPILEETAYTVFEDASPTLPDRLNSNNSNQDSPRSNPFRDGHIDTLYLAQAWKGNFPSHKKIVYPTSILFDKEK